jgi:hypothetical protein
MAIVMISTHIYKELTINNSDYVLLTGLNIISKIFEIVRIEIP